MTDALPRGSKVSSLLNVRSSTFGSADAAVIERTFVATARRLRSAMLHLIDDLAAGRIDLQGFTRRSNRVLRDGLGITYSLGALSVDPFHVLTIRDIRLINRELETERRFLRSFGRDLERGFYVLNPVSRAGLYLQALRGMFELGRIEATLSGPYTWNLGRTEHCIPCIEAALGGPYQREEFAQLGLPVLPGIPGSGEVCNGLTRCGCYLTMANGLPLPNEDLQKRIRGLLVEIMNDTS